MTLVELVIAIAIIGIAVAGVLGVFTVASRYNADPVIRKQALAIAESLMDEILSRPYTYCDPDSYDPSEPYDPATDSIDKRCKLGVPVVVEGNGPESGETRTGASRFDNVNDYDGYSRPAGVSGDGDPATGAEDVLGNTPNNWKPYSVSVSVTPSTADLGPAGQQVPAGSALFVKVTVTGPGPTTVVLDGMRTRYDPTP